MEMNKSELISEMKRYDIFLTYDDVQKIVLSKSFITQLISNNSTDVEYTFYYETNNEQYNYREIRFINGFGMTQEILDMMTRNILMSYIGKLTCTYYFKYHGNRYIYINDNNHEYQFSNSKRIDHFIEFKEKNNE